MNRQTFEQIEKNRRLRRAARVTKDLALALLFVFFALLIQDMISRDLGAAPASACEGAATPCIETSSRSGRL